MITEQVVIKGYWWLPSSPNDNVAGILTYTPNKSIELELIGQLKPEFSAMEEYINRTDEDVIFGFSSDAKEISLINCLASGGSLNFNCEFPIQRYNCQHLVIGTHLKSLDTPCFFKAKMNTPFLLQTLLTLQYLLKRNNMTNLIFPLKMDVTILIQ